MKCKFLFIQVEAWTKQVWTSFSRFWISSWSSVEEKIDWDLNSDDHSQAEDRDDEFLQKYEGVNWEQNEEWKIALRKVRQETQGCQR